MWDWWDLPVTSSRAEERMNDDLSPYYHAFEVPACPFNDIYQIHYPSDLMGLHCELMHAAAFTGFNPAMEFWMPSLMPRGEGAVSSACEFRMMRQSGSNDVRPGLVSPVRGLDDIVTSYNLMARKVVIVFHFFMDALLTEVGREQTEGVLRRALANWGTETRQGYAGKAPGPWTAAQSGELHHLLRRPGRGNCLGSSGISAGAG